MSHRRHEDDFAETASAILFQVQKAAVSCLRQKDEEHSKNSQSELRRSSSKRPLEIWSRTKLPKRSFGLFWPQ